MKTKYVNQAILTFFFFLTSGDWKKTSKITSFFNFWNLNNFTVIKAVINNLPVNYWFFGNQLMW
jgi:hypothetical protein